MELKVVLKTQLTTNKYTKHVEKIASLHPCHAMDHAQITIFSVELKGAMKTLHTIVKITELVGINVCTVQLPVVACVLKAIGLVEQKLVNRIQATTLASFGLVEMIAFIKLSLAMENVQWITSLVEQKGAWKTANTTKTALNLAEKNVYLKQILATMFVLTPIFYAEQKYVKKIL